MSEEKRQELDQNASKIDAIKELIFGQNIKEYEEHFDELHRLVNENRSLLGDQLEKSLSGMSARMNAMESDLQKNLEALEQSQNKKIEKLTESKVDKAKLGKLFQQLGDKLAG